MAKIDDYERAIADMTDSHWGGFSTRYTPPMSNTENWICVHATKYKPKRNRNSQMYIETTGAATGYKYARATVHFTLNQIVSSHMGGNWDDAPFVILTPYEDTVKINGNPQEVASEDTYFVPNPDTGLILPKNARIVRPNNDTLFSIGENVSTYKTDNFTDDEIKIILSHVKSPDRELYDKYDKCDLPEFELKTLLQDEYVKKAYDAAGDKHLFLHGLLEETRMMILTMFLREFVVRKTMKAMGYEYVHSHEDNISATVAKTARTQGIRGNSGNKGHSGSMEKEFEDIGVSGLGFVTVCKTGDIGDIYEFIMHSSHTKAFAAVILDGTPLSVYRFHEEYMAQKIRFIRWDVDNYREMAQKYPGDPNFGNEESWQKDLAYADKLEKEGIQGYNPYLDIVLRRNSNRLAQECAKALEELKQNPKYPLLCQMLQDLIEKGKKWHKTKGGWQPEPNYENAIFNLMHPFGNNM
ncbi:MAG: hypothetical protein J5742_03655 [Alphaproteobacteria bacterium]|nr:hypothetical protein [Alphaproteobacteria bacterium]